MKVLYKYIDKKLVKFITRIIELWNRLVRVSCYYNREYKTRVHFIHMYHLFCNALVHVINTVFSAQYSYTI